jgi:prepilin-type N-terminal cleavage/methylation domain-containing protein
MKSYDQQGFTLLELLIALAVLAVGLLGMAQMQLSAVNANAFGGKMSTAIALAQDQMEDLMNQGLEVPGAPFDPGINPWEDGAAATSTAVDPTVLGEQYAGYTVDWSITPDAPIANVATINVQVQRPGGMRPIELVCVKRR